MRHKEPRKIQYTIVQHSGFGYAGNRQFIGGLETRSVLNKAPARRVNEAMGLLFDDYGEAEDYCEWAMYTLLNITGLIPMADRCGSFTNKQIDGLRIYVPHISTLSAWAKLKEAA